MDDNKKSRFGAGIFTGVIAAMAVAAAVLFAITFFIKSQGLTIYVGKDYSSKSSSSASSGSSESFDTSEVTSKLNLLQQVIDKYYLFDGEYDKEAQMDSIYEAFMDALGDPYTVYYNAEDYQSMTESVSGHYYGIGVQVTKYVDSGYIIITKVFKNTPALEVGLKAGDRIVKVVGLDTTDMDLDTVVSHIKGDEGSTVEIVVERDGEELTFNVERRNVVMNTVDAQMLDNNIGYIELSQFASDTDEEFKEALEELQGMDGLIIDIRGNGGGYLDTVVNIADMLLPEGVIVYTEDKYGQCEYQYSTSEQLCTVPIVVLTDGNSASASEVLAGALKDYERATLVGTTTFGKGIVQTLLPLGDGSAVKITTSKYYTPNGTNIHGIGIEPDVEASLSSDSETDTVLETGIEVLKKAIVK